MSLDINLENLVITLAAAYSTGAMLFSYIDRNNLKKEYMKKYPNKNIPEKPTPWNIKSLYKKYNPKQN